MFRIILSIVLGAVIGVGFIATGELAIHVVYPMEVPPTDLTKLSEYVENIPFTSKLLVVVNWALSGFCAACVTNFIQGRTNYKPMLVTMGLLQLLTYMNMIMLPGHPGWMWLAATFMYIAVGFISYWLLKKRNHELQN